MRRRGRIGSIRRRRAIEYLAGRFGSECHYCGVPLGRDDETTLDHIWPWSRGGTNRQSNLVLCCKPCNEWAGNKLGKCTCRRCAKAIRAALSGKFLRAPHDKPALAG